MEEEEAETIASFLLSPSLRPSLSLDVGFSSDELTPCSASKDRLYSPPP